VPDADKYNFCRASHAEANAIAQAARHGVAIKGASLYVTLEPCYVCIKLLATAQIDKVYFELGYDSKDPSRDSYWRQEAVKEAVFSTYTQLQVTPLTIESIIPALGEFTSKRRLTSK
jgi:dCMP deaminase